MQIDQRLPQLTLRSAQPLAGLVARPGMELQATVRLEAGRTLLELGGQRLEVTSSPRALVAGETLQLRVKQLQPPILQLLSPGSRLPALAGQLRQLLPQQPSLQPLLTTLNGRSGDLPENARQALSALAQRLPDATQAQRAETLRPLLLRTGLLLESQLARQPGAGPQLAAQDFKAGLLQLLQSLRAPVASGTAAGTAPTPLPGSTSQPAPLGSTSQPTLPGSAGQPPLPAQTSAATSAYARTAAAGTPPPTATTPFTPPAPAHSPPSGPGQAMTTAAAGGGAERPAATGAEETPRTLLELGGQVEKAASRVQLLQLQALAGSGLDMLFEIPLRLGSHVDLLQLRISEEAAAAAADTGERALLVRLSFQFAETGPLHTHIRLAGQRVSAAWWAERPATAQVLTATLPLLDERLTALGFEVRALSCNEGRPPQATDALPALNMGIVDEKA